MIPKIPKHRLNTSLNSLERHSFGMEGGIQGLGRSAGGGLSQVTSASLWEVFAVPCCFFLFLRDSDILNESTAVSIVVVW